MNALVRRRFNAVDLGTVALAFIVDSWWLTIPILIGGYVGSVYLESKNGVHASKF